MTAVEELSEPQLRFGVQALAIPPGAARRWVQLGMMQRVCRPLDAGLAGVDRLEASGEIDANQRTLVTDLLSLFARLREERDDVFEERSSGPRSFMWSDALDDDQWKEIRHRARVCFAALAVGKEPLIGD